LKKILSIVLCVLLAGCANKMPKTVDKDTIKIVVATDMHYLCPEYYQDCPWFNTALLEGDGKMTYLSQEIIDEFVQEVLNEKPDYVVLTGDLTFNGEKNSHLSLEKSLSPLREAGIEMIVINGNHDINNIMAKKYTSDGYEGVDSIDATAFKEIYHDDGYHLALSEDTDSLSYRIDLNQQYSLIMLDSNNKNYFANPGSYISAGTMQWLEKELKDIKSQNRIGLLAMHHNLAIHNDLLYKGYTVENQQEMTELLTEYQVPLVLSGHIHMQHIGEVNGIYDICTSSLSISPIQYGIVTLSPTQIAYQTHYVEAIEGDEDFFRAAAYHRFLKNFNEMLDEKTAKEAAAFLAEINRCYFSGEISDYADDFINDPLYDLLISQKDSLGFMSEYLLSCLKEDIPQKELNISIKR